MLPRLEQCSDAVVSERVFDAGSCFEIRSVGGSARASGALDDFLVHVEYDFEVHI